MQIFDIYLKIYANTGNSLLKEKLKRKKTYESFQFVEGDP